MTRTRKPTTWSEMPAKLRREVLEDISYGLERLSNDECLAFKLAAKALRDAAKRSRCVLCDEGLAHFHFEVPTKPRAAAKKVKRT